MRKGKRGRYTLEFKLEAVRLVEWGQSIAEAARSLGVVEQTLANWVEVHPGGKLKEVSDKAEVTAEQMEIALHSNLPLLVNRLTCAARGSAS